MRLKRKGDEIKEYKMITLSEVNDLLTAEFEAMKVAYAGDDETEYSDEDPDCFYDLEFTPYIIKQLKENNETELKKIFAFVEKLFADGDEKVVNIADNSIVLSLYDNLHFNSGLTKEEFEKHKETMYAICGELTRKSFKELDDLEEEDAA